MRPTPGRMFFLYMRDCENEICVTAQEWKLEKIKHRKWRKQKIPSHQMNDSWGFNLFKI